MRVTEECQDLPFEVVFDRRSKTSFFDLEEIPEDKVSAEQTSQTQSSSLKNTYLRAMSRIMYPENRFRFVTRGIRSDVEQEMLFVGGLTLDEKLGRILMKNPTMVIGSDRLELYEFLARRKTYWGLQSRMLLNVAMGITAIHFVLVQIPQLSSRFFGDQVDSVSSKLGAEDQSELSERLKQAKEAQRQRKLQ